jgi:hypothetical protein
MTSPFALLLAPEDVLRALRESEALRGPQGHIYTPLESRRRKMPSAMPRGWTDTEIADRGSKAVGPRRR